MIETINVVLQSAKKINKMKVTSKTPTMRFSITVWVVTFTKVVRS